MCHKNCWSPSSNFGAEIFHVVKESWLGDNQEFHSIFFYKLTAATKPFSEYFVVVLYLYVLTILIYVVSSNYVILPNPDVGLRTSHNTANRHCMNPSGLPVQHAYKKRRCSNPICFCAFELISERSNICKLILAQVLILHSGHHRWCAMYLHILIRYTR